jgi:hypothetical protein
MLVKEGPADCTIGFERSGQFQATLRGYRCRKSYHRLCWWLPTLREGRWETRWIESNGA